MPEPPLSTAGSPVRKAVVPAAGYGTRLFPARKAVKKEFFPVVDREGRAKPVILAIAEEALSAGLESVGIVVQASDRALFEDFFSTELTGSYRAKLLPKYAEELDHLHQVVLGDLERPRDLPDRGPPGGSAGHVDEDAQAVVGEGGELQG